MNEPAIAEAGAVAPIWQADKGNLPRSSRARQRQVWLARSHVGDSDANNRGFVSNLLLVATPKHLVMLGSGPSPQLASHLACAAQITTGRQVTDIVSPWARPELVLGASAWPQAQHWAHPLVIQAMRKQCPHCIERLRARMGAAATDLQSLGPPRPDATWEPSRPRPQSLGAGREGTLRQHLHWRTFERAGAPVPSTVTVWLVDDLVFAPGLFWGHQAPDLRDTDLQSLLRATHDLQAWLQRRSPGRHWRLVGEQGAVVDAATALAQQSVYLSALDAAARSAWQAGSDGQAVPTQLPGVADSLLQSHYHALNWQRVWRQLDR